MTPCEPVDTEMEIYVFNEMQPHAGSQVASFGVDLARAAFHCQTCQKIVMDLTSPQDKGCGCQTLRSAIGLLSLLSSNGASLLSVSLWLPGEEAISYGAGLFLFRVGSFVLFIEC